MTLKELKYVLYGEDRLSGKLNRVTAASRKTNAVLGKSSQKFNGLKNNMAAVSHQVPGLSSGLALLTNPVTILGGAVVGFGIGLNRAANEAAKFNSEFRELQNLNLGKTTAQISGLKQKILDLSFSKGFDMYKVSKGFYDVQSITGKFGKEVEKVVSKQGGFADVFNADFGGFIEGSAKAMANFGFGADQLDKFNRSAFASIQIGAMTFDQFSKLSAIYAGSASSAKQSFDSANKLMAMFTITTGTAAEAATMTKSAFKDLFKAETVKAFKNAGIDMFDELNGGFRQVDQILVDLNKKFMALGGNDQSINRLKNQFKGSEGLTMLIELATKNADALKTTLNTFDSADNNFNKALKIANEDINRLNDKLQNRTKVLMAEIGQGLLPLKMVFVQKKLGWLETTRDVVTGDWNKVFETREHKSKTGEVVHEGGYNLIMDQYKSVINNVKNLTKIEFDKQQKEFIKLYKEQRESLVGLEGYKLRRAKGKRDAFMKLTEMFPDARFKQGDGTVLKPPGGVTDDEVTPDPVITKGLASIAGGGTQQKNITVNIAKFFDEQIINTTNLTEAAPEIEEKVKEVLIRAIAGAEQMID